MWWMTAALAAALAQVPEAAPVAPVDRGARLDNLLAAHRGHWGVFAQRLDTGEILADRCGSCFFTPASVTKLATTALALTRFGPLHRFTTEARQVGADVYLVGGGDPSLSGRLYPYAGNAMGNALVTLDVLAGAMEAKGIREIAGDIVGDDTLWAWRPPPDGWSHDDFTWDYGAPVSALTFADSTFQLTILPGARVGDPARLSLSPAVEYFTIDNRMETTAGGRRVIRITRTPGSRQLQLAGEIPLSDRGRTETLAVDDPALFAATAFKQVLERRGITVRGEARALHRHPDETHRIPRGETLATRTSPPLAQLAQTVNKVSQNLHAEMLLEAAGGLDVLRTFLEATARIPRSEFRFVDGSGLSRLDAITPRAMVQLLAHMRDNAEFVATLPVSGVDGSLQHRLKGGGVVRAKTGGMTGVQTLAGYLDSRSNGRVAFAIFVNNDVGAGAVTRAMIDRVAAMLME